MLRTGGQRFVLAAILFFVSISAASAQTDKVYITRTGQKYHRQTCTSLRSSKIEMSLAEAAARYEACKICKPPVPTAVPAHTATPEAKPAPIAAAPAPARSVRCQATTKKGTQCSRNAQVGSNYCWQHAR